MMFASHLSTVLEYWFFEVNAGPIALIVDWIERPGQKEHWLRVSIHSRWIFEQVRQMEYKE